MQEGLVGHSCYTKLAVRLATVVQRSDAIVLVRMFICAVKCSLCSFLANQFGKCLDNRNVFLYIYSIYVFLLFKNLKIKICKTIILPVVLFGCETLISYIKGGMQAKCISKYPNISSFELA